MRILNWILAVALILALMGAAVISLMAMFGYVIAIPGGIFAEQLDFLSGLTGWQQVAAIAAGIAFFFLMFLLLSLEFRRNMGEESLLVGSNEQGDIAVKRDSVERFAEKVVRQESAQVRDVRCSVGKRRDGVVVHSDLVLRSGANMKELNARIQSKIKTSIEQLLGLPVVDVKVRARYEPGARRPAQQEVVVGSVSGNGSNK